MPFVNPSFELGSTAGWTIWLADKTRPHLNPDAADGHGKQYADWGVPGLDVKKYTQFGEQRAIVPDGDFALYVAGRQIPIWAEMQQTVTLEPGHYKISVKVQPDPVTAYLPGNVKVYPKAGDSLDWHLCSELGFSLLGQQFIQVWQDARDYPPGVRSQLSETIRLAQRTDVTARLGMRTRWAYQNVGWVVDDWRIDPIADDPIVVVTPPVVVQPPVTPPAPVATDSIPRGDVDAALSALILAETNMGAALKLVADAADGVSKARQALQVLVKP